MRRGAHPKDAAMTALSRVKDNTVEKRLLNSRGTSELRPVVLRGEQGRRIRRSLDVRKRPLDLRGLHRERPRVASHGALPRGEPFGLRTARTVLAKGGRGRWRRSAVRPALAWALCLPAVARAQDPAQGAEEQPRPPTIFDFIDYEVRDPQDLHPPARKFQDRWRRIWRPRDALPPLPVAANRARDCAPHPYAVA